VCRAVVRLVSIASLVLAATPSWSAGERNERVNVRPGAGHREWMPRPARAPWRNRWASLPPVIWEPEERKPSLQSRSKKRRSRATEPGPQGADVAPQLDPRLMLDVFRRELRGWTDRPIRVTRCDVGPPKNARKWGLRREPMLVFYTLGVEEDGGAERECVLLGAWPTKSTYLDRAFEERCAALADHPEARPFRRLGFHLPELELSVFSSLLDPVLPALAEVVGARGAARLAPHLDECRQGARIERLESELKHYKPLRRAVLRMTAWLAGPGVERAQRSFYVKIFQDERGATAHEHLVELSTAARRSGHLRLPEPLGYDARGNMLVMSEAAGERSVSAWIQRLEDGEVLSANEMAALQRCTEITAHALRDLQRSGLRPERRRTFQDELERVMKDRERLGTLADKDAELVRAIDRVLARIAERAPKHETLVPAHGSFRHKQMVGDERAPTIIDWDCLCLASPALDPATFLARLCQGAWGAQGHAAELLRLAASFRRELQATLPEAGTHLATYEALIMIEQVLRSLGRAEPDDDLPQRVRDMAVAAGRVLDGLPQAG
jgi:hypothetical protein